MNALYDNGKVYRFIYKGREELGTVLYCQWFDGYYGYEVQMESGKKIWVKESDIIGGN